MRIRESPPMCGQTTEDTTDSHPGLAHACTLNRGHPGKHECTYCPHKW